jgi:hypothetical protein
MLKFCFDQWKLAIRIFVKYGIPVLASPWELGECIWKKYRQYKLTQTLSLDCECGEAVSLIGKFRCKCGFVYVGHILWKCPVCAAVPRIVRCYACGLTRIL